MKIGELARATGVDVETIRYYERVKLLPAPKRPRNRLSRRVLLGFIAEPAGDCSSVGGAVDAQLKRVRARVRSLRALERQLSALCAQCKLPRSRRPCAIIHELVAAAHPTRGVTRGRLSGAVG